MGRAIELITFLATAPGATLTAGTPLTGNSNIIRDTTKKAFMTSRFDTRQAVGETRIVSALLHDSTIGMQHGSPVGQSVDTLAVFQPVHAQDALGVSMTGSAVGGDIEHTSYHIMYDDLPGVDGRFIKPSELKRKAVNLFSNKITISSGTTGQYTGEVAVSSAEDSFKANTDYALMGFQVISGGVHAIRYRGPDWGNLGIGGPGALDLGESVTHEWFVKQGFIPVMNSANRSLTLIDCAADEDGANPEVITFWAELK